MVNAPDPTKASFVSTGVVSTALGLDQDAVRAMIQAGALPEPQWISLGARVERVYSIEWLMLASEQLNLRRLPGLEYLLNPDGSVQFALRFDEPNWTVAQIADLLAHIQSLWDLCVEVAGADDGTEMPPLRVRKISAGSPLDILAWVQDNWDGALGVGAVAALFIYVIKNPARVADAIPRALASWREQWARADKAKIDQIEAKIDRKRFEREAREILKAIDAVPSDTALSGEGTSRLELSAPTQDAAIARSKDEMPEDEATSDPERPKEIEQ